MIDIVFWILQGLLIMMFSMAGFGKLSKSREQHIADGHIKSGQSLVPIRILGMLELLGCTALIVPELFNFYPILTPVASGCFCIIMIAAIVVHLRKKEYKMLPLLLAVLAISAVVAYFRYKQLN